MSRLTAVLDDQFFLEWLVIASWLEACARTFGNHVAKGDAGEEERLLLREAARRYAAFEQGYQDLHCTPVSVPPATAALYAAAKQGDAQALEQAAVTYFAEVRRSGGTGANFSRPKPPPS